MRTCSLLLALLTACSTSTTTSAPVDADKGTTETDAPAPDSDPPAVTGCGVELDDEAYTPNDRLLRWPYYANTTSTGTTVMWGLPPGTEGKLEWGTTATYGTVADATLAPIDELVDPLQLHSVRLDGLEPDTTYCYQITVDGTSVTGPLQFHTAPAPDSTEPVRFLVMGDFGAGIGFPVPVYAQIKAHYGEIDFWLTTGDNAYANGTPAQWQTNVFAFYKELLRRVPFYPAAGNHDYGGPTGLKPMLDSIDLPKQAYRDEDHGRYYSFDWGPLHVTVLDSQLAVHQVTEDVADDDMIDWAKADLAAAADRPWRFASWHHPMYYTEPGRSTDGDMLKYVRPTVEAGKVAVALSGHSHVYEVYMNLVEDQKVDRGVTYVTTGGGGASPDDIDGADHAKELALRDFGRSINHFMLFEVDACTVKARAIDLNGEEFHTWTLSRDCP